MLPDDPKSNGKAQTRPAQFPAPGFVGAIETLKDPGLIFKSNANARVDNLENGLVTSFLDGKVDTSGLWRVLDRVVEQNIQQLPHRRIVSDHAKATCGNHLRKFQGFGPDEGSPPVCGSPHGFSEIDWPHFQSVLAGVSACQRQEFFDHRRSGLRFHQYVKQGIAIFLFGTRLPENYFGLGANERNGSAKLVGRVRRELCDT
jgi:hypothetical protein